MKRLLFIAYHFPPHGGAGVQRSLKFVKYLPRFGVDPVVLTSHGLRTSRWSPPDPSLLAEVPAHVTVVRTPWPADVPPAERGAAATARLQVAAELVRQQRLDAIFVSMSPFADAAFAAELARTCDVPWIADLRDPWALDEIQIYRTRWHRRRELTRMRAALRSAALVIMNTPAAAAALGQAFPEFLGRTVSLTNGYDAEDVEPVPAAARHDRFTIVHAGCLHTRRGLRQRQQAWQYRLLGRMLPGVDVLPRSHFYLLQALSRWLEEEPAIVDCVRLLLVGEPEPADRELAARSPAAALTTFTGYVPHAESVRLVQTADLLFLPMHAVAPGQRARIVPGKTYEYLATGRPILAAVPAGDARDYLAGAGNASLCAPADVDRMLELLRERFRAWCAGEPVPVADPGWLRQFERQELTRDLADHLHRLRGAPVPVSA